MVPLLFHFIRILIDFIPRDPRSCATIRHRAPLLPFCEVPFSCVDIAGPIRAVKSNFARWMF